jgi:hypothetical protein
VFDFEDERACDPLNVRGYEALVAVKAKKHPLLNDSGKNSTSPHFGVSPVKSILDI